MFNEHYSNLSAHKGPAGVYKDTLYICLMNIIQTSVHISETIGADSYRRFLVHLLACSSSVLTTMPLYISHITLKFGGVMHNAVGQITI